MVMMYPTKVRTFVCTGEVSELREVMAMDRIRKTRNTEDRFPELEAYLVANGRARMAGLARRLCDTTFVDDVIQESLTAIWQSRHQFDPTKGSFEGWASTIVRRVALRIGKRTSWRMADCEIEEEVAPAMIPVPYGAEETEQFMRIVGAMLSGEEGDDLALLRDLFSSDKPRSVVMVEHRLVSDEALRQRLHRAREAFMERLRLVATESEITLLSSGTATMEDWERVVLYRAEQAQTIGQMGRTLRRFAMVARSQRQRGEATKLHCEATRRFEPPSKLHQREGARKEEGEDIESGC